MPEISRFFGIIIYMNWREHPPAHFHAIYGDYEALITLDGNVYAGELPRRRSRWCENGWRSIALKLKQTGSLPARKNRSNRLTLWSKENDPAHD